MTDEGLAVKATAALKGSVMLSNEIIGIMSLTEKGFPLTPGIIRAMRRSLTAVAAFVDEADRTVP